MSCSKTGTNCAIITSVRVPSCRKSIRDSCRVKPLPICPIRCKPTSCIRRTKCKFPSSKDSCRTTKPCPPAPYCGKTPPAGCTFITKLTTFNTPL